MKLLLLSLIAEVRSITVFSVLQLLLVHIQHVIGHIVYIVGAF